MLVFRFQGPLRQDRSHTACVLSGSLLFFGGGGNQFCRLGRREQSFSVVLGVGFSSYFCLNGTCSFWEHQRACMGAINTQQTLNFAPKNRHRCARLRNEIIFVCILTPLAKCKPSEAQVAKTSTNHISAVLVRSVQLYNFRQGHVVRGSGWGASERPKCKLEILSEGSRL